MLKEEACLNNTRACFDEKEFTLIKLAWLIEKLGLDLQMWFCLVQNIGLYVLRTILIQKVGEVAYRCMF